MKKINFKSLKKKILTPLLSLFLVLCFTFVGCSSNSSSTDNNQPPDKPQNDFVNPGDNLGGGGTGTIPTEVVSISGDDFNISTDLSDLSSLISSENSTEINGSSETLTISEAGNYILSGNFEAGIVISVKNNETTHIFLNNASISNSNGIAISNTNKKSTLLITAISGTSNYVSNSGDDANAISIKGNLKINGLGKISISSESKNAIKVSKSIEIVDVTLEINSNNHGISARSITAENSTIIVTNAKKDGLNAECDDDIVAFPENYSEGFVALSNVNYTCVCYGDGIQADTICYISGGNTNITTNGVFVSYSEKEIYELEDDDYRYILSGKTYKKVASDYNGKLSNRYALAQSSKGIKVGEIKYTDESGNEVAVTEGNYAIYITGNANITINSTDDAIHTNSGSTLIENGTITIDTYDDGITSNVLTQINGGTIQINSCYEGLEGTYVKINGGEIYIDASDDAINAASDDTSVKEYIIINGGLITVFADGDGLDSNGSILITGGSVTCFGPTSGADGALDAETGIIIQGGSLYASSSLGMVETPSTNSTSYVLSYAQNSSISSGSTITIKDESGNELFNILIQKNCQSIIISLPDFELNGTYSIYIDDSLSSTFTISSIITSIGSNGGQNGGFNGGMPNGGGGNNGSNPPEPPSRH